MKKFAMKDYINEGTFLKPIVAIDFSTSDKKQNLDEKYSLLVESNFLKKFIYA